MSRRAGAALRPEALTGIVGFPVAHSRSPAMHNAAYAALGLAWRYLKLPLPPDDLEAALRALPASGYRGVNVTLPHKLAALAEVDEATAAAAAIGAANTLSFEDGRLSADNTDAGGFLEALDDAPRGWRALILGAGGAARAVAWALREAGAAEVSVWNRTPERAAALARELGVEYVAAPRTADLLVNATSVGLEPTSVEEAIDALALAGLDPPATVVDLVYSDSPTPVSEWADRADSRFVDGLEVLVRQGALSFERWVGTRPPLDVMREAARRGDAFA